MVLRVWITSDFALRRFNVACLNVQANADCPVLAAIDLFLAAIDSYRAILQQDTGILYPLATAGINVAVMVQLAIQTNHVHICHVLVLADHDIWLVTNIINHAVAANGFTGQDDLAREYLKTRLQLTTNKFTKKYLRLLLEGDAEKSIPGQAVNA